MADGSGQLVRQANHEADPLRKFDRQVQQEVWPFVAEPEVRFDIACACVYDGVNA